MSNWYGGSRTNYVKVKDLEGLQQALEPFDLEIVQDDQDRVALLSNSEYGEWPSYGIDDDETELDVHEHILPYLEDGQVLIIMEAGAEKPRYISGWAEAYHTGGSVVRVSLQDIYDKVAEVFGMARENINEVAY